MQFNSSIASKRRWGGLSRRGLLTALLAASFTASLGCATPAPRTSLAIAETALKHAKRAEADTVAPEFYSQAEYTLTMATKEYERQNYDVARELSHRARTLAEKAENSAVAKKEEGL